METEEMGVVAGGGGGVGVLAAWFRCSGVRDVIVRGCGAYI